MPPRKRKSTTRRRPVRRRTRRVRRNPPRRRGTRAGQRRRTARRAFRPPTRRRARKNPQFLTPTVMTGLTVGAGYIAGAWLDTTDFGAQISTALPAMGENGQKVSASTAVGATLLLVGTLTKFGTGKNRKHLAALGIGMLIRPASTMIMAAWAGDNGNGNSNHTNGVNGVNGTPKILPPPRTNKTFVAMSRAISSDYA
jgi:hypothetical protein